MVYAIFDELRKTWPIVGWIDQSDAAGGLGRV